LLNADWGNFECSFLESQETKDNNLRAKCLDLLKWYLE